MVIFHGISLHKILVHFKRRELRLQAGRPHLWGAAFLFGWAIFMMLTLHIVEIMAWAMALLRLGLIVHPANAIYFCANAYTTMGYGTVDLTTCSGATSLPSSPSPACLPLPGPPARWSPWSPIT